MRMQTLTQTFQKSRDPAVHRIDLECVQAGFSPPPADVHLKFLPSPAPGGRWTLLAHAAPGKPEILVHWLRLQPGIESIVIGPGLAPKMLRAKAAVLPPAWTRVASLTKVYHLDLGQDGTAAWFVEGTRGQVIALVKDLEAASTTASDQAPIRCRLVHGGLRRPAISRRQFEALSLAVALGYYEIPHRLDLRELASRTGLSLGSVSELLRRAEATILTHHVDSRLMAWPLTDDDALELPASASRVTDEASPVHGHTSRWGAPRPPTHTRSPARASVPVVPGVDQRS
ncbi:MAG: binding domain [Thermoplasmata archaeon]|nr:binding domain [Thermoplasmata archaeon]